MDLSTFDSVSETVGEMVIEHPATGVPILTDGKPSVLRLIGQDSGVYRKRVKSNQTKRISRLTKSRGKISPDELEDSSLDLIAECTVGWSNVLVDGQNVPFSREKARQLYVRFPWLREQAEEFIHERGNFLGNSSTSSASTPEASSGSDETTEQQPREQTQA